MQRSNNSVFLAGAIFPLLCLSADLVATEPRNAPADLKWLIENGNVKLEFYDPSKDPMRFVGHAKFHISVHTRFSFDYRTVRRGDTRYVRIKPKIRQLKWKIRHTIKLPKSLDTANPWNNKLLRHEFDHVAISTDPRIRMLADHLIGGIGIIERPFPERGQPERPAIRKIILEEQAKRRDALMALVENHYRLLDKKTAHGVKRIGDREAFFRFLYAKPGLDAAKFSYLGESLDLLSDPQYENARLPYHSNRKK